MSDLRWPHRATPRQVQFIADNQVQLWEMSQHEQRDAATPGPHGPPVDELRLRRKRRDPLGFHYWSDAILAELRRVMVPKTDSDDSPGFVEDPASFVDHSVGPKINQAGAANERKHWFHKRRF